MMMHSDKARTHRLLVMPDSKIGQIPKALYNPLLRGGWYKVGVCDKAASILESAYDAQDPNLDRTKSIGYLVGTLELTTVQDLLDAGFPEEIVLGVRVVQGLPYDYSHSYFQGLCQGFEWMRTTKAALHLAEMEELASGSPRWRRLTGFNDSVRRLLLTCSSPAARKLLVSWDSEQPTY